MLADSLPDRLKAATASCHAELETTLALLAPPVSRERFVQVLQGFYGFHAVWEPAAAALIGDEAFLTPRRRASLLMHDLTALGAPAVPEDLSLCAEAGDLAGPFEAWGSVYVMEGSTLGGRYITRALASQDWLPEGGLRYFDPHGSETGAMWLGVRERLAALPAEGHDRVVSGAIQTFERLGKWFS